MLFSRSNSRLIFIALIVPVFAGCGEQRAMTPVKGIVYYDGKPLESGTIFFQSSHGQPSQGELNPDGTFELITFGHGEGSFLGKNLVRVESFRSKNRPAAEFDEEVPGIFAIPKKYTDFRRSGIEIDIKENQTEPIEIQLESLK